MPAIEPVPVQPAATLILVREAQGVLETLLIQRGHALVFHGGAWVFPGGRVDPQDAAGDSGADLFGEDAARRAACRETSEEASLELQPTVLRPFSHWTTPPGPPRRFSTWFFIAEAPPGRTQVDGTETLAHRWLTPAAALESMAAGEIALPPPTFVSLLWLQASPTLSALHERLRGWAPERFIPKPVPVEGGVISLYAGDAGYGAHDAQRAGARHRLHMHRDGWRYERDGDKR